MTSLAAQTNATPPRLSHVIHRLENRGLVDRFPCPDDARATNVRLTSTGWSKVLRTAPGHVATVRQHVIDALTPQQVHQLAGITDAILRRLNPDDSRTSTTSLMTRPAGGAAPVRRNGGSAHRGRP
jgi:DNA-binding MarR family transcriptional regulator